MPRHQAAFDFFRPLFDVCHADKLAATLAGLGFAPTLRLVLAKKGNQFAAQFAARHSINRSVNRLVRHLQARLLFHTRLDPFAPAGYLLR